MSNSNDNVGNWTLKEFDERISLLPKEYRCKNTTARDCILGGFSFSASDRFEGDMRESGEVYFCGLENSRCAYQSDEFFIVRGSWGRDFYECLRGKKETLFDRVDLTKTS